MIFMTKVKIVAAISLIVAVAGIGVGTWSHATRAAEDPPSPQQDGKGGQKKDQNPFMTLSRDLNTAWARGLNIKEQDDIAWGEKAHGLQAGIAFRRGDQETYEVGQSVTVVVYLRNVSDKKISLSHIEPMFEEWMPVVVDAEGRRLAVAHGPINLGVVPITHRSLEAGQRITLGYPWFRIRPLGWRGDVLGPTCCAEPGRYKVGFTGLPLRLSDDKDISLGTKQVELTIGKREATTQDRAEEKVPMEKPILPGIENQEEGRLCFSRSHSLNLPFKINQEKIREVILLVSRDKGRTWEQVDRKGSTERSLHFQAPEDGMYWFLVQKVDEQGRCEPVNPSRVKASMRVCVDTTPPKVALFRPVFVNQNTVHLGWAARDANLEERTVNLEWAEHKDGLWCLIGEAGNSGFYDWRLPERMPSEVYLRIRVRDKAGNEACATTDKPERIK